jgi:RNA polymerase sigma-70 factor (ECF subfamily)
MPDAKPASPGCDTDDLRDAHGGCTPPITADAFAASYHTYVTPLYRYFYQHTGHAADAEDLTASTLSKALARLDSYAGRGPFISWLFGIARHTLRDYQRQRYRASVDLMDAVASVPDAGPSPEQAAIRDEARDRLYGRIRALPASQREALTLRYFGALHIAEIAAVLGRSEGAVKLLIHRALTALRAQYQQEERP